MINLIPIFFRIGLFTIGGGLAAIPLIHEVLLNEGWMNNEEFLTVIAISESTPGSIGVNMATFIGMRQHGFLGGVLATCALVLPSLIIITTIARFFPKFSSYPLVQGAFHGIRPAVTGLIATAAFSLALNSLISSEHHLNISGTLIFLFIIFLHDRFKWQPISLILLGAFTGVIFL